MAILYANNYNTKKARCDLDYFAPLQSNWRKDRKRFAYAFNRSGKKFQKIQKLYVSVNFRLKYVLHTDGFQNKWNYDFSLLKKSRHLHDFWWQSWFVGFSPFNFSCFGFVVPAQVYFAISGILLYVEGGNDTETSQHIWFADKNIIACVIGGAPNSDSIEYWNFHYRVYFEFHPISIFT